MIDFLASLGAFNWFILGLLLMSVELVAPGTFILWFGVAAVIVGVLSILIDWSVLSIFVEWTWQAQLAAFGILSLAAVIASRTWFGKYGLPADRPFLNRRADALVGRELVLAEPIVQGSGRVSIDDTMWRVSGPDMAAGTAVSVERADGSILIVRPRSP